jgi:hypothetical protein
MRVDLAHPNTADVHLAPGETLHFSLRLLRSREFGLPLVPPYPWGSPLARLIHGCYWLGRFRARGDAATIHLTGARVPGSFAVLDLAAGERAFVNVAAIAGFALGPGGRIQTLLARLLSPTMWLLGHPLPSVFTGPGQVLLYGQNLRWIEPAGDPGPDRVAVEDLLPAQVMAFPAEARFSAVALRGDGGLLSHLYNVTTSQVRWSIEQPARILVEDVNRPHWGASRLLLHLAVHLVAWALVWWMLR